MSISETAHLEVVRLFEESYDGLHGDRCLRAELSDGSIELVDNWFSDERSCHIQPHEYGVWVGKTFGKVKFRTEERDVAYIRSWV